MDKNYGKTKNHKCAECNKTLSDLEMELLVSEKEIVCVDCAEKESLDASSINDQ